MSERHTTYVGGVGLNLGASILHAEISANTSQGPPEKFWNPDLPQVATIVPASGFVDQIGG